MEELKSNESSMCFNTIVLLCEECGRPVTTLASMVPDGVTCKKCVKARTDKEES